MSDTNTYHECINIIEDKKNLNHSELLSKWESFKKKFPRLYEMLIITDTVDLTLLKFLCDSAEKQKKLSEDEKLENDFEIGEKLAHRYIYDKFPEPTNEQKEFIKESLRKKIKNGETFNATSQIKKN
uniref:Uncharacterized protein n=1 Tax=viral metagenome TaxID=1070528 RepID=A0A6C0LDD9_9ZZZZ